MEIKNQSSIIGAKIDWTNPSVISGLPISFSFKAKNITVILCQNWFVLSEKGICFIEMEIRIDSKVF